jgi:hypothetical protein
VQGLPRERQSNDSAVTAPAVARYRFTLIPAR